MELTEPRSFYIPDIQDSSSSNRYGLTTLAGFSMKPGINAHCHGHPPEAIHQVSGFRSLSKKATVKAAHTGSQQRGHRAPFHTAILLCFDDQWSGLDLA